MKLIHQYLLGFGLSLILTVAAFGFVQQHLTSDHEFPSHEILFPALIILAVLQLVVQVVCFLHIGRETKPRWNLLALSFALIVVGILVGGTLWIMSNLSHEQMDHTEPFIHGEITAQTED